MPMSADHRSMESAAFVPPEFDVPSSLETPLFRLDPLFFLEPLGPQHNGAGYAAWTSSIAAVSYDDRPTT
jgi:hypothetical protein